MIRSVAWVTPFSRMSDVSAFSRGLLRAFAAMAEELGARVSVFVNEHEQPFWTELPTIALSGTDSDREILAGFDLIVFNIGNNRENHGHINRLATEIPGIVIVHDMVMQHYLAWEIFEDRHRPDLYARILGEYYGEAGLQAITSSQICSVVASPIYAPWDTLHVADMPLLEPFVETAAAVVVHSQFAETFVRAQAEGPVLRLQLPWDVKQSDSDEEVAAWAARTQARPRCSVVCFGHVSRAKCLDQVVQAFAQSDLLRARARLTIAGYPGDQPYADELRMMIGQAGLEDLVELEFAIPDERLRALKRDADIFVNLRFPNTESASGSLIEQMNVGRPVLIYPTGSYAEIGPDAAIAVARHDGVAGIARALEAVALDPELRVRVGAEGRRLARRIGCRDYIARLWDFARAHEDLLSRRRACAVGQRRVPGDVMVASVGAGWLAGLLRARAVLEELDRPAHAVDIAPFLDWAEPALLAWLTSGLFGQHGGSAFEHAAQSLLDKNDMLAAWRAVSETRALWLLGRVATPEPDAKLAALLATPCLLPAAWALLASLGHEALARGCYAGLLGRIPDPGEAESYVVRLASEPVGVIVREFLHSEEFAQRGIDPGSVAPLLDWCERREAERPEYPLLDADRPLQFSAHAGDHAAFLAFGWHHLEADCVWSRVPVAIVQFALASAGANGAGAGTRRLVLTGRFTGTAATGPRTLAVVCNGARPWAWTCADDDWFSFEVDLAPPGAGGGYVLELDCGRVVNLAAEGIADDSRDLGFCLRSIAVRRGG